MRVHAASLGFPNFRLFFACISFKPVFRRLDQLSNFCGSIYVLVFKLSIFPVSCCQVAYFNLPLCSRFFYSYIPFTLTFNLFYMGILYPFIFNDPSRIFLGFTYFLYVMPFMLGAFSPSSVFSVVVTFL